MRLRQRHTNVTKSRFSQSGSGTANTVSATVDQAIIGEVFGIRSPLRNALIATDMYMYVFDYIYYLVFFAA